MNQPTANNTNTTMNTIAFPHYDKTAARIFTIMRCLERSRGDFTPRHEIRASLRIAWLESPDAPAGCENLRKALAKAKKDGLLVTERGACGGCRITESGKELFCAELAARKYMNASILRKEYRAYLWPQPPAAPALPLAA